MLDPRLLRTDLPRVAEQLKRRGLVLDTARFEALEARRKAVQIEVQELQGQRNARSKGIGKAKAAGQDIAPLLAEVDDLGARLKALEESLTAIQDEVSEIALGLPNLPDASVPDGRAEADNREGRRWGEPPPFGFEPKDDEDLGGPRGCVGGGGVLLRYPTRIVSVSSALAAGEVRMACDAPRGLVSMVVNRRSRWRSRTPRCSRTSTTASRRTCAARPSCSWTASAPGIAPSSTC